MDIFFFVCCSIHETIPLRMTSETFHFAYSHRMLVTNICMLLALLKSWTVIFFKPSFTLHGYRCMSDLYTTLLMNKETISFQEAFQSEEQYTLSLPLNGMYLVHQKSIELKSALSKMNWQNTFLTFLLLWLSTKMFQHALLTNMMPRIPKKIAPWSNFWCKVFVN